MNYMLFAREGTYVRYTATFWWPVNMQYFEKYIINKKNKYHNAVDESGAVSLIIYYNYKWYNIHNLYNYIIWLNTKYNFI